MPHIWNNKVVVTKDELIPDYFPTWEALRKKLSRESKRPDGMKRARQGKGMGNEVLILFDTLPLHIREALGDPRKVDCILERYFWTDPEAVTFFANKRVGKRGYIAPERQAEYVMDASTLKAAIRLRVAHIEECVSRGISTKNTDRYLSESVNNFNRIREMKKLPTHNLPTNHLSLKRKIKRFETEGYESLLSRYDNNNANKKTEKITALLNAMYIQKEKPTQMEVYRLYEGFLNGYVEVINPETGEIYNPADYGKLSERTVTSFLASWREKVATHLKRAGNRQQYMQQFDPYQSLYQPETSGAILSIDDRQPPFYYTKTKDRMWFYNGIDLGSECIVAFVWGKSKEGIILDFYRELVRNCAEWGVCLPAELECESSLNASFRDTFLREGNMFQYVRILANAARSKRIERYYGNIRYDYEKARSGWIGRPFALNEAYQRSDDKIEVIPYDTLVRNCLEDIMTWNNSPHTKYPDKTRWEIWLEKQDPELKPINWRGILPYIGDRTETSCKAGIIRLNSGEYLLGDDGAIYTGDPLLELMEVVEGKDVEVYWLRGHDGQVLKALVYREGRCICEAIEKPKARRSQLEAARDPNHAANFELVERYKATVRGWARKHKNEIEKLIIVDNRKRTLNDKFKISWMDRIALDFNKEETEEVEVLEENKPNLNTVERPYNLPHLQDRF